MTKTNLNKSGTRARLALLATALVLPMAGVAFAQSQSGPTQASPAPASPAQASQAQVSPAQVSPATGAAATLPNTFDRPAEQRPRASATAETTVIPSDPAKVAAAETALKTTIAAMQSGTPNYADMTPDLAAKVLEQAATVAPLVKGFGELLGVTHVSTQNGSELFLVMFANAPTQWIVGQNAEGKITALLFRPAPAAPPATAPAT